MFSDYPDALWNAIPMDAQENIVADDLAMKEYIKVCEARMEIHNR